mmetsp:Transcript_31228/g.72208  ORF Transcript_31228/g.72208 Transcript_31228/m.72208 type:complete len:478 (-) Transcript_31228:477-1910(-)
MANIQEPVAPGVDPQRLAIRGRACHQVIRAAALDLVWGPMGDPRDEYVKPLWYRAGTFHFPRRKRRLVLYLLFFFQHLFFGRVLNGRFLQACSKHRGEDFGREALLPKHAEAQLANLQSSHFGLARLPSSAHEVVETNTRWNLASLQRDPVHPMAGDLPALPFSILQCGDVAAHPLGCFLEREMLLKVAELVVGLDFAEFRVDRGLDLAVDHVKTQLQVMLDVLLHDQGLKVVRLAGELIADFDGLCQLRECGLEAILAFPVLDVESLPGKAQLGHSLGEGSWRTFAPQLTLLPSHFLQGLVGPGSCLLAVGSILLDQPSGQRHCGRKVQMRHKGHVVGPSFRCQQLVKARVVREAAGDTSPLNGLHHLKECLLVDQRGPTVTASFAVRYAVLFKTRWVEMVHCANLFGSPHRMMVAEDEMGSVSHLDHVRLILYVNCPDLVIRLEVLLKVITVCIDENVRHRAACLTPLRRGHDLV